MQLPVPRHEESPADTQCAGARLHLRQAILIYTYYIINTHLPKPMFYHIVYVAIYADDAEATLSSTHFDVFAFSRFTHVKVTMPSASKRQRLCRLLL